MSVPITTILEYREGSHVVEIGRSYAGAAPRDFDYWYRIDDVHSNRQPLESEAQARSQARVRINELDGCAMRSL